MPSDIRSFFGGKGSQIASQSQESPAKANGKHESSKAKARGKRKVVSDSDDDEEVLATKTGTPKKAIAKKLKKESPKAEVTSTSDYFASKTKPSRTSPVRSKKVTTSKESDPQAQRTPKSSRTSKTTPIATPHAEKNSAPPSTRSSRTTKRNAVTKNYAEPQDDEEDDVPLIKQDEDSGEDVFEAEYKGRGAKKADDYESSDAEDVLPKAQSAPKAKRGQKGKSNESSDEDNDDRLPGKGKTAKATPKKPAVKKARTPRKQDQEPEDKEIQDIFDSIPVVRPPTPPPRDDTKKFDWKAKAGREQPVPSQAGSIEIPTGEENCLAGLTFVFTGVLDVLGREEGQSLVKRYGGKVTTSPSSKTDYVVLGTDAGPKKLETIQKLKIKTINEEGLFALIKKLPANGGSGKQAQKFEEKRQAEEKKIEAEAEKLDLEIQKQEKQRTKAPPIPNGKPTAPVVDDQLWTTKYAPMQMNQICGNKTQVEKLQSWLRNWHKNAHFNFKKGGADGSGLFRAVMIHGSPGIGKTTAAHLAAKLEGYDIVESNASDTRSKKLIEGNLKGVLDTTSISGYFAGDGKKVDASKKNLVLIMDEVDGMSAGDRGGVGAMAAICKKTNIPIILICNERKLPKMKPFDHVTYDLPFRKPTVDQVRSRIMTILFREGMKDMIPPTVVNSLIEGSGADIRRIINMISTAKIDAQKMDFTEGKKMASAWEKHVILKPWDITQKILGGGMFAQSSKATLNDKIELYFNDHEFSSLMLQENYLATNPINAHPYSGKEKNLKLLELADNAAQSISDGDLCDAMIHGTQQQWSLMPTHAVLSFVRPASFISGNTSGQVRFTSWLGNNSRTGKLARFVKDIQAHMRLRCAADRHEIRQQYLPVLWMRLVKELETHGSESGGIEEIISLMDSYFLTKDDWDAIYELGLGPCAAENVNLSTQNKTQFTRKYNAMSHPLPFMKASGTVGPTKKGKDKPDLEEAIEESDEEELLAEAEAVSDGEEELDLKKDKYVQQPKKRKAPAASKKSSKKAKVEDEDKADDAEVAVSSEEDVKPRKGKGKAKAGAAKGRAKK